MRFKSVSILVALLVAATLSTGQAAAAKAEFEMCEQAKDPKNYANSWVTHPLVAVDGRYLFAFDPAKAAYIETYNPETLAQLKRFNTALKSKGIQLIAVIPPNRQMAFAADRKNAVSAQNSKTYDSFVKSLNSVGILTPNLLNEISTKKVSFDGFFLKRDVHWSQDGAEYTAKLIANLLKKQPAYAALPKTNFTLTRGAAMPLDDAFAADLRKACGKAIPAETSRKIELNAAEPVGLLDETPAAPVAVVGTSFVGSKWLNFAEFLSATSKLSVENFGVEGGLNYDSFLGYLASSSYQKHKPKIIVWESLLDYPRNDSSALRQLIASVYGRCGQPLQQGKLTSETVAVVKPTDSNKDYLYFDFGVPTVKSFTVNLQYEKGKESVQISQAERVNTAGAYFLELKSGSGALKSIAVTGIPKLADTAKYAVCRKS